MRKALVVMGLVLMAQVANAALLSESTKDNMASNANMYSLTSGLSFTTLSFTDPLDSGDTNLIQRSVGGNQEVSIQYKTVSGKVFGRVKVTYVMHYWWGHGQMGLRYSSDGGTTFTNLAPMVTGTLTYISDPIYYQVCEYDLGGLHADAIQLWMNDSIASVGYSPNIATVDMTVGSLLLTESTKDNMSSGAYMYSRTSGLTFTTLGFDDPLDSGDQNIIRRSVGDNQEVSVQYRTASGKVFGRVKVTFAMHAWGSNYQVGLRYSSDGGTTFTEVTPAVIGTLTPISGDVYYQVREFDLGGLNANAIQVWLNDSIAAVGYSPNIATVDMTVGNPVLTDSTKDNMSSGAYMYSRTSGLSFTTLGFADPLDAGDQNVIQRSVGNKQEVSIQYKTASGKYFQNVKVTDAFYYWWGHAQMGLRYSTDGGTTFTELSEAVTGARTNISDALFYQVLEFDLNGLNANVIQVYVNDQIDGMTYAPYIATVDMALSEAGMPVFSPVGKCISDQTPITISSTISGASIYYTNDGTKPTTASNLYTGPITLSAGTTVLKAIAVAGTVTTVTSSKTYVVPASYNDPASISQGSATIDGNLSDWSGVTWTTLDHTLAAVSESELNADVPEAYYAARWLENKIYVAVKVRDTMHYFRDVYTEWTSRDAIEIFLHTNGDGPLDYSVSNTIAQQYAVGIKDSDHGAVWATVGANGDTNLSTYPSVAKAAGKVDGEWLYYEVEITPYTYFGLVKDGNLSTSVISQLTSTLVIGLDVEVISNSDELYNGKKSENDMQEKYNNWSNIGLHKLVAAPALRPGDANGDGMVDVGDLGILAANYGGSGKTWAQGDFNGDHLVDVGDLGILAAHYGEGANTTLNFDADYTKAFGSTVTQEDSAEETSSSVCSALGLPLVAGLALMGLMLVKLEE
jgi:hypothetical protein